VGVGVGEGEGLGEGSGVALTLGEAEGVGEGLGVAEGEGVAGGVALAVRGWKEALVVAQALRVTGREAEREEVEEGEGRRRGAEAAAVALRGAAVALRGALALARGEGGLEREDVARGERESRGLALWEALAVADRVCARADAKRRARNTRGFMSNNGCRRGQINAS
jgi:hypothetical protein